MKTDSFYIPDNKLFLASQVVCDLQSGLSKLMAKFLRLFTLLLFPAFVWGQGPKNDSVIYTLYLVGDSGEPIIVDQPLGGVLRQQVKQSAGKATVLFLGDNIYPKGMPDRTSENRALAETILNSQVQWVRGLDAKGIFVPGNHDWQRGKRNGFTYIQNQQQWLDSLHDNNIMLLPRDGCPGPVEIPLTDKAVLVILDTQWFLHPWDKPGEGSNCEVKNSTEALALLSDVFARNANKRVILAAHHPLITHGEHGGVFLLKDHIFPFTVLNPKLYIPLPIIGSVYPLYRKWFGDIQDVKHPIYKKMSQLVQQLMAEYPGSIYTAGHEHALQYLVKDSSHFIVSGSGSKTSFVKQKKYSRYAAAVNGFAKLEIYANGSVEVRFWQVDNEFPQGKEVFTETLRPNRSFEKEIDSASLDFSGKTIRINASNQYDAGKARKIMLGENYRAAWAQEIEVPVFDLGQEQGGLKILQKGGGMQTLSLRVMDSAGREFVLRSVEKFPEKAIPEMLRKTFAQDLVQDQISASHPYAAVVIPRLADAAGIYHTNPKIVYIPDDPRLGIYRRSFANTLSLFEERPAGDWSDKAFFGNSKDIINTSKVLQKRLGNNENHVDQSFVLRSRIFDIWIGDWDRHDDQWRWASFKSKKRETYRPIPRDRDQAFFVNEGVIPRFWSHKWTMPQFEGFDDKVSWPSGLSYGARYFDRSFLTELTEKDWIAVAKDLQEKLTDRVIEESILEWPDEIYRLHGEEVIRKLKARRTDLITYAVSHYKFLARTVDIVGSDKKEKFDVNRLPGGDVHVRVFNMTKDVVQDQILYDRLFKRSETKEIRIYGLDGDDRIEVTGTARKSILIRVIGGDGMDSLIDKSHVNGLNGKTLYYDLKGKNSVVQDGEVSDRTSHDPAVNTYDRRAFEYDRLAPLVIGNFNPDDGLFIGGGMSYQTEAFRDAPFNQRQIALFGVALGTSSFNFLYRGDYTDVIGRWGLEINADLKLPHYVSNFFGPGNESEFDQGIDEKPGYNVDRSIDYYRFRFEELKLEAYFTRRIGSWGLFKAGPTVQRIELDNPGDKDRYIKEYAATVPYNAFEDHNIYTGASWRFTIDKRNSERFTTRGVVFHIGGKHMAGISTQANDFSSYESSVSFYQAFRLPVRVVFAARMGGGLNSSKYEFYQSQVLNGTTELRGFRKMRFYGDRKIYANLEMRIKLLSLRTYLFPASVGILGFHDLGRVWYKDENNQDPTASNGRSNVWHKGWGGGIWFTPFNLAVLSVEAAHSNEGTLGYLRLGFLF